MAVELTATSAKVTASSGNSWRDIIQAIHDHFDAISAKFGIVNGFSDGTSIIAFTINCVKAGEDWHFNVRLDTGTNTVYVCFDPEGTISNSTDPLNNNASSTISPENTFYAGAASYHSDILISEMDDALFVLLKSTANDATPRGFHAGKIILPFFANMDVVGITGDGYLYGQTMFEYAHTGGLYWANSYDTDSYNGGRYHQGAGNWGYLRTVDTSDSENIDPDSNYYSGGPQVLDCIPVMNADTSFGDAKVPGAFKYCYYLGPEQVPLTRMENATSDKGFLYVNQTVNPTSLMIPWDPTVVP